MEPSQLDLEKYKIQRYQLWLQVASVLLSGFLVYTLIAGKGSIKEIDEDHPEFNPIWDD
jgi:hypothetical protein